MSPGAAVQTKTDPATLSRFVSRPCLAGDGNFFSSFAIPNHPFLLTQLTDQALADSIASAEL
jgi:hypothetical protein